MSLRPIYVVCYSSPMFPAHWALWIPSAEAESIEGFGKLIHVSGDAKKGFIHEFKRNYNMATTTRPRTMHLIGWTDATNIADAASSKVPTKDATATNVVEEWALKVAAPGPSLRSAGSSSSDPPVRVRIQNCQTWLREFVAKLVEVGILTEDAVDKLDNVPKN